MVSSGKILIVECNWADSCFAAPLSSCEDYHLQIEPSLKS